MSEQTHARQMLLVFIGSYADAANSGVYVYKMCPDSGQMELLDQVSGLQNPSFLNVDAARQVLYAIAERKTEDGQRRGAAAAYAIDPSAGKLTLLNRTATVDTTTCHIQRDATGRFAVVASYSGGKIGLIALEEDGRLGELLDTKQHEGSSVNPERQEKPHPHSAFFSPDNRFVFIPDLGLDRIKGYRIDTSDSAKSRLLAHADTEVQPGAGPRHMAFHPSGAFAYVINELDSTVTSFRYNAEAGTLHTLDVISTLPPDYAGDNACAEIQISRDGKFLYGSNRGHDSIVVYAIDPDTGKLTVVEHTSTRGQHPRHFALSPEGRFLIVANRDTDNIVVYRVDAQTGKLEYTGHTLQASKPVCVQPVYFPEQ